jgi:hypothetical protein
VVAVGACGGDEEPVPFSFDPDLDSATIDVTQRLSTPHAPALARPCGAR